uniref:Clp R domain-containing protein n=1 Tax=uncultured Armatimonadetes bacterium TaxID=157466 RepID=A0A6J4JXD3_9BACT|nr:hypothetical protein AVDCRST_MAG63-4305 [uncultured Armatimonadetes bacterium]
MMEAERWTGEALRTISLARNEAGRAGDSQVCTEHLLLGVLGGEDDPQVPGLLEHFGIAPEQLRREIEGRIVRASGAPGDGAPLPLAPRTRRVLDLAEAEADLSGGTAVRPAHVLLGLVREEEGLAGRVLAHLGARHTEEARGLVAPSGSA